MRIFAAALLPDENGSSLLFNNAETLVEMYSPTSFYLGEKDAKFCHGFISFPHLRGSVIGHAGDTSGFTSMLVIDLINGVSAVVMTNQTGEGIYNYKMLSLIFGDKDFSGGRVPAGESNIAGIYYNTRGIFKGSLKIIGITGILPITKDKDGVPSIPMDGYEITYAEPGRYKITVNDSMSMLIYADIDSDGHVRGFSLATWDYIRTNWGTVIFDIVTVLFFVIAYLYGLVTLIIMLIRRIRKKAQPIGGFRAVACVAMLATTVNIAVMIILASSYVSTLTVMIVHGILFIVLAVIPVVYAMIMAIRMKQLDITKKQMRQVITTAVIGLLVDIDIIYWQLCVFWI